jgi:hypothetical protein
VVQLDVGEERWQDFPGRAHQTHIRAARELGRFEVDLDYGSAFAGRDVRHGRGGVDDRTGSNHEADISFPCGLERGSNHNGVKHLAEPDHVRSHQPATCVATRQGVE